MSQIAEEEKRDEETHRKKQKSSSQVSNFGGSEATIEDELDDYDNFITGLEKHLIESGCNNSKEMDRRKSVYVYFC
ncbi:unnamed protein product [Rhizophagus irregularis]|nr:unnamed protein product [Rhizophagus irregularis]